MQAFKLYSKLIFILSFSAGATFLAQAAVINVDGIVCDLTDAITSANSNSVTGGCPAGTGVDTINLHKEINFLNNGFIASPIIINGNGNTIDGKETGPVLSVYWDGGDLTLINVTVANGREYCEGGAGISAVGPLKIINSIIRNNTSYVYPEEDFPPFCTPYAVQAWGNTIIENSHFLNNGLAPIETVDTLQLGLSFEGSLTIRKSTIEDNIEIDGNLELANSTVIRGLGVGLGSALITESTVTGRLDIYDVSNLILRHSIISHLHTFYPWSSTEPYGGNLFLGTFEGYTPGASDIIANSDGPNPIPLSDILETYNDNGTLKPLLSDNGGPTPTVALVPGSPAINAYAAGVYCPDTDQRGITRPQGAACDIGAYESGIESIDFDIITPARKNLGSNLNDGDLTTSWNTDGNSTNAWFEIVLALPSEITQLKLAPRTARAYKFNVYVDNGFVGQYTTASTSTVKLQSFALPAGTAGQVIRVEAVNKNWFKVYEVELLGQPTVMPDTLTIIDSNVSVKASIKHRLHDGNLTTSWNNDGNMGNAWFNVMLDSAQAITELRLAPRINRVYTFNVYVNHVFVDQYTTVSVPTIALQSFALPPGTSGSHIRIESLNHNWFKVHEIELYNGAPNVDTCGNELAIDDVTVPARQIRKKHLVDNDFSSTSFWSNSGETWFELSLNREQEINCLQLAPRENRTYTFNVYIDDNFVAQYTTEKANTIALQNFRLPKGTMGSVVRIESLNSNWFKVHEVKLHGGFVNVALNSNVQLKGAPFFTGGWGSGQIVSASTIVDGIFLPRSRQWDQGAVWWDSTDDLDRYIDINLDGTYSIHSFTVQADDNDPYDLLYWDLTTNSWRLAWAVPSYNAYGSGMQTRPNPEDDTIKHTLPSPVTTNALRLKGVPNIGSIGYSVSEIQAFGLKQ